MNPIECSDVSELMCDHVAGRLSDSDRGAVMAHLAGCAACRGVEVEERAVADLLRTRLPRHPAPDALKRRLTQMADGVAVFQPRAESWSGFAPAPASTRAKSGHAPRRRWGATLALAAMLGAAIAALLLIGFDPRHREIPSDGERLVAEAVNDHLRILYAQNPLEIESGGIHQVKPWFAGRLDFAPIVAFDGDAEFALEGGSVAYFVDRKAAVFEYKLRLHKVSLFVFRADGLRWSDNEGTVPVGTRRATVSSARGFHTVLLHTDDLGYAIVSDASQADLVRLMGKVVPPA